MFVRYRTSFGRGWFGVMGTGKVPALAAVILVSLTVSSACGPSKPTADDYLGHWEGTYRADSGSEYPCHLHITMVGQSLVIKSEDQTFRPCENYAQVLSLAEDGTVKGGPMGLITLLFDKTKNEIIVSGVPTSRNLRKDSAYHAVKSGFQGTWQKLATDGVSGNMGEGVAIPILTLPDILIIELLSDGTFKIREKEVMDNAEFRNVVYENGTIKGTFHMARDRQREWRSTFEIKRSGDNTITYRDERGEESLKKQ